MKRILIFAATFAALLNLFNLLPVQAQQGQTVLSAQGNPYLIDFFARQNKRSDIRINVTHKGLNAAFSEWLSTEHPDAYRASVKQLASRTSLPITKEVVRSGRASGSCCIMASGCCSMCPACCKQKNCAKSCCNLSACALRPNCCK